MSNPQSISCISGTLLIGGLFVAATVIDTAAMAVKDFRAKRGTANMLSLAFIAIAITMAIPFWVPDHLLLSLALILVGLIGIVAGAAAPLPLLLRGLRGGIGKYLASVVRAEIGVRALDITVGVVVFASGMLGLLTYFGLLRL